MAERVTVAVVFMSQAECVRRVKAANDKDAEEMLCTLEADAMRAGRKAMREEAATFVEASDMDMETLDDVAAGIRALPIEPKKEGK